VSDVKINDVSSVLSRAMQVAAKRQDLLSDNVANVDTPFYKRKDLNFKDIVEYVTSGTLSPALEVDNPRHFRFASGKMFPRVQSDDNLSWRSDGNNVDIDKELVELMQNSMWYGGVAKLLSQRFSTLRSVLTSLIR